MEHGKQLRWGGLASRSMGYAHPCVQGTGTDRVAIIVFSGTRRHQAGSIPVAERQEAYEVT